MGIALLVIGLLLTFPHAILVNSVPTEEVNLKIARITWSVMAIGVGLFFVGLATK